MSKDLQIWVISVFWFAVSPNHVKLTVDGKLAREAHLAWGATGGRAHCQGSTYCPTMALTHGTNAAPPAACAAKCLGSQVSNLSDSIVHLHGMNFVFLCLWS